MRKVPPKSTTTMTHLGKKTRSIRLHTIYSPHLNTYFCCNCSGLRSCLAIRYPMYRVSTTKSLLLLPMVFFVLWESMPASELHASVPWLQLLFPGAGHSLLRERRPLPGHHSLPRRPRPGTHSGTGRCGQGKVVPQSHTQKSKSDKGQYSSSLEWYMYIISILQNLFLWPARQPKQEGNCFKCDV